MYLYENSIHYYTLSSLGIIGSLVKYMILVQFEK